MWCGVCVYCGVWCACECGCACAFACECVCCGVWCARECVCVCLCVDFLQNESKCNPILAYAFIGCKKDNFYLIVTMKL